jgi:hypothetical protein
MLRLDSACFLLPCLPCSQIVRRLVLRLVGLTIEAFNNTKLGLCSAECREQAGAPSSWLAGGPAQPSQPTCFCQAHQGLFSHAQQLCASCELPVARVLSQARTRLKHVTQSSSP